MRANLPCSSRERAATPPPTLVVSELFGPTVQGEGPSLGRRASFLRLMGCNLTCSWCDTPYTWDADRFVLREQGSRKSWADIVDTVLGHATDLLVVTGGEPLLHQRQRAWKSILRCMSVASVQVEVETNGTVVPAPETVQYVTRFNVSPKLAHAGMSDDRRTVPDAVAALLATEKAVFKFVCRTEEDVEETVRWCRRLSVPPCLVWVMPEGTDPRSVCDHLAMIATPAVTAGFNLTARLHTLAWGDARGH